MRSLYQLIDFVLWFYSLLLIIYVVTGLLINFGVVNAYNRVVSGIYEFLMRVTEPVLRPIRRILPNFGPVDLSPLVVFLLIWFARNLLAEYWPVLMGPIEGTPNPSGIASLASGSRSITSRRTKYKSMPSSK